MIGNPDKFYAKVILDSRSWSSGVRLLTMELQFPRFILAEFNTHRVFSKNSASSRAIPARKQVDAVRENLFIPPYWGKNVAGMQAPEEVSEQYRNEADMVWYNAAEEARGFTNDLIDLGIHKQHSNRLLEPFLWHKVIVTSTEWRNFFALRVSKMAQPEMRMIAEMALEAYRTSEPDYRDAHIPYLQNDEYYDAIAGDLRRAMMISAGRCARVSYLTHDGVRDPGKDFELAQTLLANGHMSPFEHQAIEPRLAPGEEPTWSGNLFGWTQFRKTLPHEAAYVHPELDLSDIER